MFRVPSPAAAGRRRKLLRHGFSQGARLYLHWR